MHPMNSRTGAKFMLKGIKLLKFKTQLMNSTRKLYKKSNGSSHTSDSHSLDSPSEHSKLINLETKFNQLENHFSKHCFITNNYITNLEARLKSFEEILAIPNVLQNLFKPMNEYYEMKLLNRTKQPSNDYNNMGVLYAKKSDLDSILDRIQNLEKNREEDKATIESLQEKIASLDDFKSRLKKIENQKPIEPNCADSTLIQKINQEMNENKLNLESKFKKLEKNVDDNTSKILKFANIIGTCQKQVDDVSMNYGLLRSQFDNDMKSMKENIDKLTPVVERILSESKKTPEPVPRYRSPVSTRRPVQAKSNHNPLKNFSGERRGWVQVILACDVNWVMIKSNLESIFKDRYISKENSSFARFLPGSIILFISEFADGRNIAHFEKYKQIKDTAGSKTKMKIVLLQYLNPKVDVDSSIEDEVCGVSYRDSTSKESWADVKSLESFALEAFNDRKDISK